MSTKKALSRVGLWVGLAMLFNAVIYFILGKQKAIEFLGGYVIEQSLSIDNLFLFLMIFTSFGIKPQYQRRVLSWGIAGAIVLRLIFILLGVTIINKFSFVIYIFGAILIFSGIRMAVKKDAAFDPSKNKSIKLLSKIMPVIDHTEGNKFFIKKDAKIYATPLFAVLLVIETSDIIFAVDSIPAVFSMTTDTFIVYTSNIFAILGLRSMYFVLGKMHEKFKYVKYGVAMILTFTGGKMLVEYFGIKIPILMSLCIIFAILAVSVIASIIVTKKEKVKESKVQTDIF